MVPDDGALNAAPPHAEGPQDPRAVFDKFTRRLIGLARGKLGGRLMHKIDPEDVVQSVYKSFFIRYGEERFLRTGEESLWGLLTLITLRKCSDRIRYHLAQRRDVDREESSERLEPWREAIGREPTPEHALALAETVEIMMRDLDPEERGIVELSLQGYSAQEISGQLGRAERSVRRLRELVRKRLERMQQATE